jgi:APA family basic amino acid/polyamine antiporter
MSPTPKIGYRSTIALVIGSVIGSGVFMKPATMAEQLGSPVWLTAVWVLAGLFSLFGALVYAELGAMMPENGGIYVYFRRLFGEFPAFLYGWAAFSVINTAAIAAITFVCAYYADHFLHLPSFSDAQVQSLTWHIPFIGDLYPLKDFGVKSLAIVIILSLTYLNVRSLKAGSYFQNLSTILKLLVIGALVFGIFFYGKGTPMNFIQSSSVIHPDLLGGIVAAMTGAFFAYDGWINVSSMAGEIRDPQRNIPRSLWVGVLACVLVYVAVNQAYLYVLPIDQMAGSSLVASDAMRVALGQTSEAIVAGMIVLCTFGAINGNVLATARITYAMGKDNVFPAATGKEHMRFHTPANALWLHGVWTCLFILTGSFDMLADMFVFITWIAYGMGAVGIFMLRRKEPHATRPYRIWGHPFVTIAFILFTFSYLIITLYTDVTNYLDHQQPVINSVLGLAITLLGVPFYFIWKRRGKDGRLKMGD